MTRNEWDDDDDDQSQNDGSNLVKDLRKQLKEALKTNGELTTEVEKLGKVNRTTALKDIFSSKTLNPKIAAFYPSDGEATPEAVETWVKEYGDVFGIQAEPEPEAQTTLDANTVQQFQRMSDAQGDTSQNAAKNNDLLAKMRAASTPEELNAVLAQLN